MIAEIVEEDIANGVDSNAGLPAYLGAHGRTAVTREAFHTSPSDRSDYPWGINGRSEGDPR